MWSATQYLSFFFWGDNCLFLSQDAKEISLSINLAVLSVKLEIIIHFSVVANGFMYNNLYIPFLTEITCFVPYSLGKYVVVVCLKYTIFPMNQI